MILSFPIPCGFFVRCSKKALTIRTAHSPTPRIHLYKKDFLEQAYCEGLGIHGESRESYKKSRERDPLDSQDIDLISLVGFLGASSQLDVM